MSDYQISTVGDTLSRPDNQYSMVGGERTPIIEKMFSLFIWDMEKMKVVNNLELDPAYARNRQTPNRTNNAEYFFRVPPKVHEMDEPFATKITPTQGGGKYVESYGSILKEVRISGTTGLRPHKKAPEQIPVLGVTIEQLQALGTFNTGVSKIPDNEATGIDDIIFLRNIFRHYSDLKQSEEFARKIIMVWRNVRTDDYWVVEPKDFRLVQNAQSPLTYQYNISLTTLVRFEAALPVEVDPQQSLRDRRRFVARIQQYSQNLTNIYFKLASSVTRVQGMGFFALNTVVAPLISTIRGLNEIKSATEDAIRGLISTVRDLSSEIVGGIASLVDFLGPHDPVVRELRRAQVWCAHILSEQTVQDTAANTASNRRSRIRNAYAEPATVVSPRRSNAGSSFLARRRSSSVAQDTVLGGEDIRATARRLLGDARAWQDLVIINDLRPPYIATVRADGVLIPGDPILYPSAGSAPSALTTEVNPSEAEQENQAVASTGPAIRAYGRDIALKSVDGQLDLADLAINNRGDISTTVGVKNVEQAVRVKFATEQGELPAHPYFGAQFAIGTKSTISSYNEYRVNAMATLRSDARIDTVNSLKFIVVGDTLMVSADLVLAKTRDLLSTNFALRQL